MKQKLLYSFKLRAIMLVAMICASLTGAWADDVTLTAGTNGSACTVNGKDGIKLGTSTKGGDMTITVPANTTKLTLHAAAWKGVNGLSLNISGATVSPGSIALTADDGVSNNSPFTLSGNESDFEFEITLSDITTETALTFTTSTNKRCVIWDASAVVAGGGDPSAPSISAEAVAVAYNATSGTIAATIDNAVEGGVLTAEITDGNDGSWLSLDDVDGTNVPLIINSNNDGVISRSATVTLTYTYNTDQTTTQDVTVTQGVNPIYGSSTNPYTVAQAKSVIDAAGKTTVSGKYVTGIVSQVDSYNSTYNSITYWISDDGTTTGQFEVYGGLSFDGGTAFSSKDNIQVGDVVVVNGNITYYDKNTVYEFEQNNNLVSQKLVAPTFYPAAGAVGSGTELTITDNHPGSTIYYTTDGSTPTTSSTAYNPSSKPTITAATTFKAIAVKTGDTNDNFVNSDDASASYTLLTPAETPVITLAGGTYSSTQSTTITCETAGATIYYTTDGTAPTTSSTEYSGAISINESMTIKAIAAKDGMANSAVATATYTISIPAINAANVNITCEDTEGSIAYTITNPDGGALTAEITGGNSGSWLTLGAVSASAVAFTCTTNSDEVNARTTTVTLTYTYDTDKTVTKDVTVTQAKHEEVIAPAVAGVGAFVKVTDNDDITNGTYLIVYEGDATHDAVAFDGSLTTLDAAKNTIKVNIIDDKIESSAATAAATFEIRPESGTIKSKSNKYIGNTSNSNALTASDSELTNTFDIPTESNTNNNVDIVSSGGAYLRYNKSSGQERFRYFKSGTYSSQQAIALYKYDATETPFATAKLNSEGYATFSSAAKIDLSSTSGFTAWQITGISGETITFGKVTSVVPVGTGLLLWGNENEVVELTVTDDAAFALSSNWLVGTPTATDVAEGEAYGLSGNTFVVNNAAGTIPAGRAYLPAANIPNEVKSFTFVFEDTETGITETRTATRGEVEAIFNLAGQRLSKMKKGINIVNGKKVLVK